MAPRPVVVAVGTSGSDAALRHAAALALRTGAPLHLLHVVELLPGDVPPLRPPTTSAAPPGDQVLHRAGLRARELVRNAVPVDSELAHGEVVDRIVAGVAGASYVVLEQSDQPAWALGGGEICARVATQVAVPVYSIPRGPGSEDRAPIVSVGVKDPLTAAPLVRAGMDVARATDRRLRVVHVADRSEHAEARRLLEETVAALVAPVADASVEVLEGLPVSALREVSRTSGSLVLGRHHRQRAGGGTLGPVARSLVRHSGCPVLLPSPARSVASGEWVFQTDWA